MASNYPGSLDSFDTIASDKKTSDSVGGRTHRQMHNDLGDAIEAVQTELGTNPSGSDATVAARLTAIEAGTNLAAGSVTAAKLGSDVRIGNLLTANVASGTDTLGTTSGMTADNATIARSTAWAAQGSGSVLVTATAGNPDLFLTGIGTSGIPVTPGEVLTAVATVKAGTNVGRSGELVIDWYNAGGSYMSNSTAAWTFSATPYAVTHTVTAPANAAYAVLVVSSYTATTGETFYIDKAGLWYGASGQWAMPGQPILGLTDAPIGNLLTPNQASLETDTTGWAANYNTPTISQSSTQAAFGTFSLKVVATANAGCSVALTGGTANYAPVVPGATYTATASVFAETNSRSVKVYIKWYTSGGSSISDTYGTAAATGTGAWVAYTVTGVAPATAAYVRLYVDIAAAAISDTFYIDKAGVWKGASGQWSLPGTPIVGGSHIATNGAVHLSGTGSPEGAVTAAPGSTWLQTDATTDVKGWIRWVKATGTGNTGWQAGAEADTGWRDVSGSLLNSWTGGTFLIRRVGSSVSLFASSLVTPASFNATIYTPATGFAAARGAWYGQARNGNTGSLDVVFELATNLTLRGTTPSSGNGISGTVKYVTDNAWPSVLPGSAA